jgi:arylsulfatase A-like enzyme
MRAVLVALLLSGSLACGAGPAPESPSTRHAPNLVFILADDLGYGELGCYGQKLIRTPNLDRLAAEGMRFTQFYAGATVCAPSRSVLMTGRHGGRTWVRGNGPADVQTLRSEDVGVAERLRAAGYATALCGKWGLGEIGSTGHPNRKGFDHFFGYLSQHHAHNYYPPFLVRNEEKVALRNVPADAPGADLPSGAGWAKERVDYSHDLIAEDALAWLRRQGGRPFFLYLALTIPHANNEGSKGTGNGQEVPDLGDYADRPWPDPDKGQAAMIARMDRDVGRLLELLRELGLERDTLVLFSSDNGHHQEGRNNPDLFDANGPLRGKKRDLYEGGIRVPFLARWPGTVPAGVVSDHLGSFADFMPTACELAGVPAPDTDGLSLLPLLQGRAEAQPRHAYLYWEFYEQGSKQAVRFGDWKAVRMPMFDGKTELYDLSRDLGEEKDLAAAHPEIVAKAEAFMKEAHVPNPNWKVPAPRRK